MAYLITIASYLIVMIIMGILLSRRAKTQDDFMVAGRQLTAPVLVGTLLATWIGSGDIFSVADLSYHHGFSSLIGSAGGWLGIIIVYFIAGRVRDFGQYTVPDILEKRYNKWARVLATITTIIAYVTIVSYQFRGGGWVLNIISNGAISTDWAILLVAIFVTCYTLFAGMISVAYLDVLNGILIVTGVFLAIPFMIKTGGGLEQIAANVTPREHAFLGNMSWIQAFGYFVPTFLLALGNGNMYQRFFSARDAREARRAVIGWVIGVIILGIALQTLVVIGSSVFKGLVPPDSGKIMLKVAYEGLPLLVGCLLLAAIIAIIISTANSFLLVPATNIIHDIYQRFINPELNDRKILLYSRLVVIFLGFCAYLLIEFFPRILDAAYAAYTIYGAGITPALFAVFFWKRATANAAVCSIVSGMGMTIIWEISRKILNEFPLGIPAVYPALLISILTLIVISLLETKPLPAQWKPFYFRKER